MTDSWATLFERGGEYDVDLETVRERYEAQSPETQSAARDGTEGSE
jgi:hypothetical protein